MQAHYYHNQNMRAQYYQFKICRLSITKLRQKGFNYLLPLDKWVSLFPTPHLCPYLVKFFRWFEQNLRKQSNSSKTTSPYRHVSVHRLTGYLIVFYSLIHTGAHLANLGKVPFFTFSLFHLASFLSWHLHHYQHFVSCSLWSLHRMYSTLSHREVFQKNGHFSWLLPLRETLKKIGIF